MESKVIFKVRETSEEQALRVANTSIIMGLNGIGPRVISYDYIDGRYIIALEEIPYSLTTADLSNDARIEKYFSRIDKEEFIEQVNAKIKLMHTLGYAHGDLTLSNIVYRLDPFVVYIIDWESAFPISSGVDDPHVNYWMREMNDWDGTYQEFIDNDYNYMASINSW